MQLLLLVAVSFAFPACTHVVVAIAETDQVERPLSTTTNHSLIPAFTFHNMVAKDSRFNSDREDEKAAASVADGEERMLEQFSNALSGIVAATVEKGALEVARVAQAESSLATKVAGRLPAAGPVKALPVALAAKIAKPRATKGTGKKKLSFLKASVSEGKAAKHEISKPAVATKAKTNKRGYRLIINRYDVQERDKVDKYELDGLNGIARDQASKIERRPRMAATIRSAKKRAPVKKEGTEGGETSLVIPKEAEK
uniref:Uncharacterized protein n=1 Tax=Peronospora matthiolae TaxID=2874970 RepID=A0AAV1UR11_9STRA